MNRDELLTAFLAEHDETCPQCGYNLRALTGQACPECGAALRLRVGLVEPRIAAYISLIAALFLGFGGALLFSLLALIYAGLDWFVDAGYPSGVFLLLLLISTALIAPLAVLGRRRIMRLHASVQWVLTAIVFGYVIASFALILMLFDG